MVTTNLVAFIIATSWIVTAVSAQTTACPRQCRCDSVRKTVYCMNKQLLKLPLGIPTDTRRLLLQDNYLVNGPDLDNILSTLTSLERLELSNNSLTAFPKHLPTSVNWISMKENNIKYIGSNALYGLTALRSLNLDNNSLTNQGLSSSAFAGAENLHTLSLQGNLLTSVPLGMPRSIRNVRLSRNRINTVGRQAVEQLSYMVSLDLSHNVIDSASIERYAMQNLYKLRYLDLSRNSLTFVPPFLPGNLSQLLLSHNRIKSISAASLDSRRTMSLAGLSGLEHLDLSFNRLESVEPGSFSGLTSLRTMILHDNPWTCDCHLKYLKQWLMTTSTLITMQSNTVCSLPLQIQGVTLQSLDEEVLICQPKPPVYNISVSPNSLLISWLISDESSPDYTRYSAFCGEFNCENCSQQEIIENADAIEYAQLFSTDSSYDIFPVDHNRVESGVARIDFPNRKPNQLYILCLLSSYGGDSETTVRKCEAVKTTAIPTSAPAPVVEAEPVIPIWLVILIALLGVMAVISVVLVILCRKYHAKKQKWKRGARTATSQMTYDPFRQIYAMPGDSRNDKMIDPSMVGGVNIANYREGHLSSTKDAGKEFDVTLVMYGQNHNYLHQPTHNSPELCDSYCSDCHNDTISTSHTRTDGSSHSQLDVEEAPQRAAIHYERHMINCNERNVAT